MPQPRRTSTAFTVVVTAAVLAAVVLLHPSSEMESVRRLIGLGKERRLERSPAPWRGTR